MQVKAFRLRRYCNGCFLFFLLNAKLNSRALHLLVGYGMTAGNKDVILIA